MNRLKLLIIYLSACKTGRLFLKNIRDKFLSKAVAQGDLQLYYKDVFFNKPDFWKESFLVCDKAFDRFIPKTYLDFIYSVRKPFDVYFRFNKMAVLLLLEHLSLFEAYQIPVDKAAKMRSALLSFLKRIYDDLLDDSLFSPQELFSMDPSEELLKDPEFHLYYHLRKTIRKSAPPELFPNYYSILEKTHHAQSAKPTRETAQDMISQKVECSMLMDSYIMINNLPESFLNARLKTAHFLSCLDDLYDIEEDISKGKITYMNQIKYPEKEFQKIYDDILSYLKVNALSPKKYIQYTGYLFNYVLEARRRKLNKLNKILNE